MRGFLDAGVRATESSDYTASPADPMMWLQSQLTRTDMKGNVWGANQRITLQEAIRCGTVNGAYAAFEENLGGIYSTGPTRRPGRARSRSIQGGSLRNSENPGGTNHGGWNVEISIINS